MLFEESGNIFENYDEVVLKTDETVELFCPRQEAGAAFRCIRGANGSVNQPRWEEGIEVLE